MVSALESKLLGSKKTQSPAPAPEQVNAPAQAPAAPIENHEVSAPALVTKPTKAEVLLGFSMMNPKDVFLYGIDDVPEGFDESLLAPFADPYRLAYDDSNPGYAAYKGVAKEWGHIKKPASVVPVTSNGVTLFVANDGRQSTKIAREHGFQTIPVVSSNETDAKEIALYTVASNTGIQDSILVKAAKAQVLVDMKIPQRTIAPRFGIVQSTLNGWLKLNKATPYLQQLIVNYEHGVTPGVPWTTAATFIQKKWTDDEIKATVEGVQAANDEDGGEGEGENEGGEGEGTNETQAPRTTAASIFGSFKDDLLAVVNAKGFELPETLSKATPVEMFIMGIELAFAKKTDHLAEDFRKSLNAAMTRHRKAQEAAIKRAANKAAKDAEKEKAPAQPAPSASAGKKAKDAK